jgi:hypothetical protein
MFYDIAPCNPVKFNWLFGWISLPSSGLKSKTKVKLLWIRQQVKFVPCRFLVLNHSWILKMEVKYSSETSAEVISYKASINTRRYETRKSYNKDFDYIKVLSALTTTLPRTPDVLHSQQISISRHRKFGDGRLQYSNATVSEILRSIPH